MDHQRKLRLTLLIIRWSARTVGLALLLLAGAFFLEHLEWLSHPGELPPVSVLAAMFFHFALLAGLVLGWRWELLGGLVVIAAGTGFFLCVGRDPNLLVRLVAVLPGLLFILSGWLARRQRRTALQS